LSCDRAYTGHIREIYAEDPVEFAQEIPADIQLAIRTPEAQRTPGQKLLVAEVIIGGDDVDPDNLVADANASAKAWAAAKANQVFGAGTEYSRKLQ
jgi:hypothetical protein